MDWHTKLWIIAAILAVVYWVQFVWFGEFEVLVNALERNGWRALFAPRGPRRRAEKLLKEYLNAKQRRDWRWRKSFVVAGTRGRRYRVRARRMMTPVAYYLDGVFEGWFCAYIRRGRYPLADQMLAIKLLIEADEEWFLATACYARRVRDNF